jgi:uncharacterized protein YbdZ (MbtH family)
MDRGEMEASMTYKVVVNHEEQYSIWPTYRENPLGWKEVGKSGSKAECLDYIKKVWTDMRPLSLRRQMEEAVQNQSRLHSTATAPYAFSADSTGDDLVKRLSEDRCPVEVGLRPERTIQELKECIGRGYLHIEFTHTRGGTELGVRLDTDAIDLSHADFDHQTGSIHLEGDLILNYVKVRCVADIDLQTLTGQGHLVPIG